jgi:hypothetical protein
MIYLEITMQQPMLALVRSYNMEIIKNQFGTEVVIITNEDGSTLSMLKSTYDEQQAQQLGGNSQ